MNGLDYNDFMSSLARFGKKMTNDERDLLSRLCGYFMAGSLGVQASAVREARRLVARLNRAEG